MFVKNLTIVDIKKIRSAEIVLPGTQDIPNVLWGLGSLCNPW